MMFPTATHSSCDKTKKTVAEFKYLNDELKKKLKNLKIS